jgi:hypothetical protein
MRYFFLAGVNNNYGTTSLTIVMLQVVLVSVSTRVLELHAFFSLGHKECVGCPKRKHNLPRSRVKVNLDTGIETSALSLSSKNLYIKILMVLYQRQHTANYTCVFLDLQGIIKSEVGLVVYLLETLYK